MRAFRAAVEDGVDALETDLHISKDGVLVISHVSMTCMEENIRAEDVIKRSLTCSTSSRIPHYYDVMESTKKFQNVIGKS